jgi:hypothetical protein
MVVLTVVLGLGSMAFLFLYLPYLSAKEEEAQRVLVEARKAAEQASRQVAEAKRREAEALARLDESRRREADAGKRETDTRVRTQQQRADDQRQQRAEALAQQQARQRRQEQDQYAWRAAAEQRQIDEMRLQCETYRKLPASPSREAMVHQACTRYDDAVRRQHYEALNRQYAR